MITENNIISEWTTLLEEFLQNGKSVAIGTFDTNGQILMANTAMCYFLDADAQTLMPKNSFVNPEFSVIANIENSGLVFEGLLTIGNRLDISYALSAKIYRHNNKIQVIAEVDIPLLFNENKIMSIINQDVNNLQRQLIREKKNLQDTLLELRETQQMLIQSEKMNALGKMVAGVAHEINNPIAFVYSNLYSIEQYVSEIAEASKLINDTIQQKADKELLIEIAQIQNNTEWNELLNDVSDMSRESKIGLERIKNIVEDLRKFSRLDEAEIKQIDLIENIKSTVNIVRAEIARKQIDFEMIVPQQITLECYPGQLNQAIMNVLINAIDAVDKHGKVCLEAGIVDENICITITDNGSGIPDEIKNRIFEPFFTTKPVGSGVGLGLSITYKIIHDLHCGSIELHSIPQQSTSFKITIPTKINKI